MRLYGYICKSHCKIGTELRGKTGVCQGRGSALSVRRRGDRAIIFVCMRSNPRWNAHNLYTGYHVIHHTQRFL